MMYRFKGFTEKASNALNLAIESASDMGHTYVGSEHVLLGLIKEGSGVAYTVLNELGVEADALEELIRKEVGSGVKSAVDPDDFTPRTKRILQLAMLQASQLGHNYVGTEHLLIALIQESDSYAVRFLQELGV